jgi:hypothetical protein
MLTKTETIQSGARGLADALAGIRSEALEALAEVQAERRKLEAERRKVERSCLPKDQALAALDRTIADARMGLPGIGELLDGQPLTLIDPVDPRDARGMEAAASVGFELSLLHGRMQAALLGLCADQIVAIYRQKLEDHYAQPGVLALDQATKTRRLRELDREILDCWRIAESIVRAAEASGLDLPRDPACPPEILLAADSELPR